MGNPYYIPRRGALDYAATTSGIMGQLTNQRIAQRQLDLGERAQTHQEAQDKALLVPRQQASEAALMNAQTARAELPDHKKPFAPSKVVKTRAMFQQQFGNDAKNFEGVFAFFDKIASNGGSNAEALDDAMDNWRFIQAEFVNGYQKTIDRRIKDNPNWINSPEGRDMLAQLDLVKGDPSGEKFLAGKMFRTTANSIMREDLLMQAELAKARVDQWGALETDQYGNTIQRNQTTGEVRKVSSPQRGMMIETKDGTRIMTGVDTAKPPAQLTTSTRGKVEQETIGYNKIMGQIDEIKRTVNPKVLEIPTRIGGTWAAMKDKFGLASEEEKQLLQQFTQARAAAGQLFAEQMKELSGVAVTPQEAKRQEVWIPKAGSGIFDGDSPEQFMTKVGRMEQFFKGAIARLNYVRANGLTSIEDVPMDSMPSIINRRGKQLEAQGMNPQQVREALADEFGLRF